MCIKTNKVQKNDFVCYKIVCSCFLKKTKSELCFAFMIIYQDLCMWIDIITLIGLFIWASTKKRKHVRH